jgi:hypothetical protein
MTIYIHAIHYGTAVANLDSNVAKQRARGYNE